MGRKKAQFEIKDLIITVACPECEHLQDSPGWPGSQGWDKKDVKATGSREIKCPKCFLRFQLPSPVFSLMSL